MSAQLGQLLRTERLSLLELLEGLPAEEWAVPSLCAGWTVHDVAAHLAWAPVVGVSESALGLVRAGLRMNRFIADSAVRWSGRGRDAILTQLRDNARTGVAPMGMPRESALTDAIVHALDVRLPVGRPRAVPPEAFVPAADWLLGLRWPMTMTTGGSTRHRVAGVRLVAGAADWSHGTGPEAHGSTAALMLLLTGRPVSPGELTGPGADRLLPRP